MDLIKLAGVNFDSVVGAIEKNYNGILHEMIDQAEQGATVCASPEMALCGYPAEDLVQWRGFVDQQWDYVLRLAFQTRGYKTVFILGLAVYHNGGVYNCAAVVHGGKILGIVPKEKLPTYNVFYDLRHFARGSAGLYETVHGVPFGDLVFEFEFGRLAVEICEDIWSPDGPMKRRAYAGAEVIVNISASPWRAGVGETRREMLFRLVLQIITLP